MGLMFKMLKKLFFMFMFFYNLCFFFFKNLILYLWVLYLYLTFSLNFIFKKIFKKSNIMKETTAAGRKMKYFGLWGYTLVLVVSLYYLFLSFLMWFDVFIDRWNYTPSLSKVLYKYIMILYFYFKLYKYSELEYYKSLLDFNSVMLIFVFPLMFLFLFFSDYIILMFSFTLIFIFIVCFGLFLMLFALKYESMKFIQKMKLMKELYFYNFIMKYVKYKYSFYTMGLERRSLSGSKPFIKKY